MSTLLQSIEQSVLFLADHVPLEVFVFFGSLTEEIIAPIPAMLVMTTAGFLAQVEGHTQFFLLWLVLIGNLGKVLGSLGWYVAGDKLEDFIVGKLGRFFSFSHAEIEKVGQKFTGHEWRDGAFIFLFRCIPFFPTMAFSIACGVIKLRLRTFLIASYLGNACKDLFYILAGYFGTRAVRVLLLEIERVRLGFGVMIVVVVALVLILAYRKRHHGFRLWGRFINWWRG